jgi:N-acetylglucosamine malate deacetylase 1
VSAGTIAVIAAHPDDEVLGFGGVIARNAAMGKAVHILIAATGSTARNGGDDPASVARLRDEGRRASAVLGATSITFGDFPDNRLDAIDTLDMVREVERFLAEHPSGRVYTHYSRDLNVDHQRVARAVLTACRALPGAPVRQLYAGEVLSSTEWAAPEDRFVPNAYVGIADVLARKVDALKCYVSEIKQFPHPRSPEGVVALATLRGSECGLPAAEAFRIIRDIEP